MKKIKKQESLVVRCKNCKKQDAEYEGDLCVDCYCLEKQSVDFDN